MKSYINVYQSSYNDLTHIYIEDGIRKTQTIKYQPFLGIHSSKETKWKDIFDKDVLMTRFDSISSMKEWKKENSDLEILSDINPIYQFISETYKDKIEFQKSGLFIGNFDIECLTVDGAFPNPEKAEAPITAITIQDIFKNIYYVFGYKEFDNTSDNVNYFKCKDEEDLLFEFVNFLNKRNVDILTGWYINNFDIPYLVNRITIILGEEFCERLSPNRKINRHENHSSDGKKVITYSLQGRVIWDYMELYQKFTFDAREGYSLDYISKFELGEQKLEYKEEYGNLDELYSKNFQKYIEYNIKDVELVFSINKKLKYIELALNFMYMMKCQPSDIFGTTKAWDAFLFSELLKQKIVIPASKQNYKEEFPGGFCKEPQKGLHKWITVFDIVSSYPSQIRSCNISPEMIIEDKDLPQELFQIRKKFGSIESCIDTENIRNEIESLLKKYNICYAANGSFYRKEIQGIIPKVIEIMFEKRMEVKKQLKSSKNDPDLYAALDSENLALKVALNSLYGALSNIYFRYFDIRMASAITSNGQVCARGVAKYLEKKLAMISTIYQDTDSGCFDVSKYVYERFKGGLPDNKTICEFILKFQDKIIQPKIDEYFNLLADTFNFKQNAIKMEHECIADIAIFKEKKKYILQQLYKEGDWYLEKPKLKIKGIEVVQTSTPQIVRDKLKEAIELIFKTQNNNELINFVKLFQTEFYELSIEKIAFTRSVNFAKYNLQSSGLPIGVRAAFVFNELIKKNKLENKIPSIKDGNKIKFTYIRTPNIINSNVIGYTTKMPEEFLKLFQIDYDIQFEKTFKSPLRKLCDLINWKIEETSSLEDFF